MNLSAPPSVGVSITTPTRTLTLREKHERPALPRMRPEGFHGLLGRAVDLYEGVSEGSAEAIALQLLVASGAIMGPGPWLEVGSSRIHARQFLLLVGASGVGRKGSALEAALRIVEPAAPGFFASGRLATGVASGEGLIAMVAPGRPDGPPRPYPGQLLVLAPEFAAIAAASSRGGSTLSPVLRSAWDGLPLQVGTKNEHAQLTVTKSHVAVISHVTPRELSKVVRGIDVSNGFLNRFLIAVVERRERLALPNPVDQKAAQLLSHDLKSSIEWAATQGRIPTTAEADSYWRDEIYPRYEPEYPRYEGDLAELTTRALAQISRAALTLALLDRSAVIHPHHYRAATAIWDCCEDSILHLYSPGDPGEDAKAQQLLAAVRAAGPTGLTGRQQHDVFNRHITAALLDQVIRTLTQRGQVVVTHEPPKSGTGRRARVLVAREHHQQPTEKARRRGATGVP